LFEAFGAGSDRFEHRAFADFIADTRGFEILDDRLFPGFSFCFVDGVKPDLCLKVAITLT
jgi:hypothetical protein